MGESTGGPPQREVLVMKKSNLFVACSTYLSLFGLALGTWFVAGASSIGSENSVGVAATRRDGIILLAVGVVIAAFTVYQVMRPQTMTIDAEGFTVQSIMSRKDRRRSWDECGAFQVRRLSTGTAGYRAVTYTTTRIGEGHRKFNRLLADWDESVLPGFGGLGVDQLAQLMNAYRNAALRPLTDEEAEEDAWRRYPKCRRRSVDQHPGITE